METNNNLNNINNSSNQNPLLENFFKRRNESRKTLVLQKKQQEELQKRIAEAEKKREKLRLEKEKIEKEKEKRKRTMTQFQKITQMNLFAPKITQNNNNNSIIQKYKKYKFGSSPSALHSFILSKNILKLTGYNLFGQIGNNSSKDSTKFITPTFFKKKKVLMFQPGREHSIFLTSDYKLYSAGSNSSGECGIGKFSNAEKKPREIILSKKGGAKFNNSDIKTIRCGDYFSLILTNDGKVYSFGLNKEGQLGVGDNENKNIPTLMDFQYDRYITVTHNTILIDSSSETFDDDEKKYVKKKIISIYSGSSHSFILTNTNELMGFGKNAHGQLGNSTFDNSNKPTHSQIPRGIVIRSVHCGRNHSFVISHDYSIFSFGDNRCNCLAIDKKKIQKILLPLKIDFFTNINQKIIDIAAGWKNSFFLSENGKVYSIGFNGDGELGLGDNKNRTDTPCQIKFPNNKKIVKISSGVGHTFALTESLEIFGWGYGGNGQIGHGKKKSINNKPIKVFQF